MAGMKLITPPAEQALDLASQVKMGQLRLDASDTTNDAKISSLIDVACDNAEKHTARALITQQWRQYFDGFPAKGWCIVHGFHRSCSCRHHRIPHFELWRSPVKSVEVVKYLDPQGEEQTLDAALYETNLDVEPSIIRRAVNAQWPICRSVENSVWIEFTAGYGDTFEDVPASIGQGMLLLITEWYENRLPVGDLKAEELPFAVNHLFDMNKVWYL